MTDDEDRIADFHTVGVAEPCGDQAGRHFLQLQKSHIGGQRGGDHARRDDDRFGEGDHDLLGRLDDVSGRQHLPHLGDDHAGAQALQIDETLTPLGRQLPLPRRDNDDSRAHAPEDVAQRRSRALSRDRQRRADEGDGEQRPAGAHYFALIHSWPVR